MPLHVWNQAENQEISQQGDRRNIIFNEAHCQQTVRMTNSEYHIVRHLESVHIEKLVIQLSYLRPVFCIQPLHYDYY